MGIRHGALATAVLQYSKRAMQRAQPDAVFAQPCSRPPIRPKPSRTPWLFFVFPVWVVELTSREHDSSGASFREMRASANGLRNRCQVLETTVSGATANN